MPDTHVSMLQKFIGLFHRRMLGVYMKSAAMESLGKKLAIVYTRFRHEASNPRGSVMFLSFKIYEVGVACFDPVVSSYSSIGYSGENIHSNEMHGYQSCPIDDVSRQVRWY